MNDGWIMLGWVVVIGLPLTVVLTVILWPERIPRERSVECIRERLDSEDGPL